MAPNLDGSPESDEAACPIGTLCVLDDKPRETFGIEERKKLVSERSKGHRSKDCDFRKHGCLIGSNNLYSFAFRFTWLNLLVEK